MAAPTAIASELLSWYDRSARALPWRIPPHLVVRGRRPDPYHVWLSEIMLQQTTVAAVKPYFRKFLSRWPTLKDLAEAHIDEIMGAWAGLGYYSRARNLHECARRVMTDYAGYFPTTAAELQRLPGIGPYTAAAIAAIAFDEKAVVIDGNIERVVSRLFACPQPLPGAKTELRRLAAQLTPARRVGDYAQAMMDLGATLCTPRNPLCALCPIRRDCVAGSRGDAGNFPLRAEKPPRPVRRAIAFWLSNAEGEIWIRRRPAKGLLGGMLEIPSSLWAEQAMPALEDSLDQAPAPAAWTLEPHIVTHVFTHFTLELAIASATFASGGPSPGGGFWSRLDGESEALQALPSVMRKIAGSMSASPSVKQVAA